MNVNEYGQVQYNTQEVIEKIYSQEWQTVLGFIDGVNEIAAWNENCTQFDLQPIQMLNKPEQDPKSYHQQRSLIWKMPLEYTKFDPIQFFSTELERLSLNTQEYIDYLCGELEAWNNVMSHESAILLWKFLNYLMTTCKENDIITGVGRGSSVSSLILYLLGVHAVDPVKYKLNYEEFLR